MSKPIDFIQILEPATNRVSSLAIHGNRDDGTLRVVGGLSHNTGFIPQSQADADKLIKWLQDWKQKN